MKKFSLYSGCNLYFNSNFKLTNKAAVEVNKKNISDILQFSNTFLILCSSKVGLKIFVCIC